MSWRAIWTRQWRSLLRMNTAKELREEQGLPDLRLNLSFLMPLHCNFIVTFGKMLWLKITLRHKTSSIKTYSFNFLYILLSYIYVLCYCNNVQLFPKIIKTNFFILHTLYYILIIYTIYIIYIYIYFIYVLYILYNIHTIALKVFNLYSTITISP